MLIGLCYARRLMKPGRAGAICFKLLTCLYNFMISISVQPGNWKGLLILMSTSTCAVQISVLNEEMEFLTQLWIVLPKEESACLNPFISAASNIPIVPFSIKSPESLPPHSPLYKSILSLFPKVWASASLKNKSRHFKIILHIAINVLDILIDSGLQMRFSPDLRNILKLILWMS